MRQWTAAALAAQKQIAARLSREGIQLVPDFVFTRTFNGFSAPIDGRRARAARARRGRPRRLSRCGPPTRRRSPRRSSAAPRSRPAPAGAPSSGSRGFDGSGITVALLDTGVDVTHPFIRDRLLDGVDMLDPERRAIARAHPDEPTRLERHGTQLAGLIAGQRRPGRHSRRRRRRRRSCRSASPAGSRAPRVASPSTAAPTSCSPESSAPSTPTRTATCSMPHGSPSWA